MRHSSYRNIPQNQQIPVVRKYVLNQKRKFDTIFLIRAK